MSVVTEHLEQRGAAFEVLPHRQAYTSIDEARALGVDADEVLKTLAVRTGPGYVLVVIPAARRLDLQLVREALGDNHARLATEEELDRDFADYQLGALPPLGALVGVNVFVDPEVLGHDTVVFAAGTQTQSVKRSTQELFGDRRDHDRGVGQAAGTSQRRTDRVGGVSGWVGDLTTRWTLAWHQPWGTRHGGHWLTR
jgi:Ala-tRNA(Pro) deacylase